MVKINTIGELLKSTRQKMSLNQSDMASVIGCERSYLSQIETGRKLPGELTYSKIVSSALKAGVEWDTSKIPTKSTTDRYDSRSAILLGNEDAAHAHYPNKQAEGHEMPRKACEEYLKEYLDAAQEHPIGMYIAWIQITRNLDPATFHEVPDPLDYMK